MRGVLHMQFLNYRFLFAILEFLFDNAEKWLRMVSYTGEISRYAEKVLFSGVFVTDSIFQDGG